MKFSRKVEACGLSPMRKYHPYALSAKAAGKKIYHLNIGQPDIETPPIFFEAIRAFQQSVLAYAPSSGMPELVKAICDYYNQLEIPLAERDILVTSGGSEALQMALSCILDEGDEILVPEPFYPNYNTFIQLTGGSIRPICTVPEEGYRYAERSRIEPLINTRTRAIMITNPGNPTGVVLTKSEMRLILDIAVEHDLFIIGDEVYREFVYGGEPLTSLLQNEDAKENVIVIDSVSKRFSACGARVGMLISRNHELMSHAMKLCQGRLCSATLDQVGAAALYSVGPDYYQTVRDTYKRRRDTCCKALGAIPGVVCDCPEGAFYIMAKLPVDDTDKFQTWLLEKFDDCGETVMFAPGEGFYTGCGSGTQEVRLAYVLQENDLKRAIDILAKGIAAYNAST